MCFGMSPTETKNTTQNSVQTAAGASNTAGTTAGSTAQTGTTSANVNPAVQQAALGNLDFVKNLQDKGFQGYGGQQVANLSPGQQGTIDAATGIANNGTGAQASNLIGGYASAPAQNVNASTISSAMSPYMNEYVMRALAPQLQQMDVANAKTRQATDAHATGSGAFGDARTGLEQAQNSQNANVAREGLIGSAYNTAFNTAIGAGAQDVSNKLAASNANAGYNESALNRSLGGATALQGLQTQQLGTQGTANTLNQQNTAKSQADLTAMYNQWLMAQQYPFQTQQLANSTLGQATTSLPAGQTSTQAGTTAGTTSQVGNTSGQSVTDSKGTSETQKPDNSGLALLGSLAGTAGNYFLSDFRAKDDVNIVGGLIDGTPVYSYHYKADPKKRKQIGLMAQDVKQRRPDAIATLNDPDGTMMVDYAKATERSRLLSMAI